LFYADDYFSFKKLDEYLLSVSSCVEPKSYKKFMLQHLTIIGCDGQTLQLESRNTLYDDHFTRSIFPSLELRFFPSF